MESGSRSQRLSLEEALLKICDNETNKEEFRGISDDKEHELNHELGVDSDDCHQKHHIAIE